MPSAFKVPTMVNFIVNINYKIENDKLVQTYNFMVKNKKHLAYAYDKRYCLKQKLDKLFDDFCLKGYIDRVDEEDKVIFYYELQELPKPVIRNLQFYLPPYAGCEYCSYAEKKGVVFYCPEKQKFYNSPIKTCKIFKSKSEIVT